MNTALYLDTTHLVRRGHEGWLELTKTPFRVGEPFEVLFKWGHNMKIDGFCRKERLFAYVCNPEGIRKELIINEHDLKSYIVSFISEQNGYYQVIVGQNGIVTVTDDGKHLLLPKKDCVNPLESTAFTQYAKAILPVGDNLGDKVKPLGNALELAPQQWQAWKVGDAVKLQVLYLEQPVTGATVNLIYKDSLEANGPLAKETGNNGFVEFILHQPGYCLFLVRHVDHTECKEDYYEQRRLTATLSLLVTK